MLGKILDGYFTALDKIIDAPFIVADKIYDSVPPILDYYKGEK